MIDDLEIRYLLSYFVFVLFSSGGPKKKLKKTKFKEDVALASARSLNEDD